MRYEKTNITAGAWYRMLRDCETPRSPLPVVAKPRRAMGMDEQLEGSEITQGHLSKKRRFGEGWE